MRLSQRLKKLGIGIFDLAVVLIEDRIEAWATTEPRSVIQDRLRAAAERGGALALQVSCLEDELDKLRFNGPSLWCDEVELLQEISRTMRRNIVDGSFTDLKKAGGNLQIIEHLLDRCDHMTMTAEELDVQVRGITDGTIATIPWEDIFWNDEASFSDPGVDIDEPQYGHDYPPPGFEKCTRPALHDGPCAHPFSGPKEIDCDDIPF